MYGIERLETGDGALVVRFLGEFDFAAEGILERTIDEALAGSGRVVVDLSGITFLDARRTLELVFRFCLHGGRLALTAPSPQVAASVRACGLQGWVRFEPTASAADPAACARPRKDQ
ncbi:MAG: STAS domain-containing protein [Actinomycetota bacterium]